MRNLPIPESIQVLLDSYRDDSDLETDEFAPLRAWLLESPQHVRALEASKSWNRQMHRSLRDVPLPDHLAEQIRTALRDGRAKERVSRNLDTAAVAQRTHGRWKIWAAVAFTISAAVLVYISLNQSSLTSPANPSALALCQASIAWIREADKSPWPIDLMAKGEDQPFVPKQIARKLIYTGFGPTDCYLMTVANGRRIFQFVFRVDRSMGLPDRLPPQPDLPTGGYVCSAYQQGNRVYVVAVEGNAADYRQAIEQGLPLTVHQAQARGHVSNRGARRPGFIAGLRISCG